MNKRQHRQKRHNRVRARVRGTKGTPRVSVFRSNQHIFVQIIDDTAGRTLMSAGDILKAKSGTRGRAKTRALNALSARPSTFDKSALVKKESKTKRADLIGEVFAKKAKEAGVSRVVFDRGGYKYHGRVKALAEGLRKGGLKF